MTFNFFAVLNFAFRSSVVKLENEFAVMSGESKDLGMRHVRLEKV